MRGNLHCNGGDLYLLRRMGQSHILSPGHGAEPHTFKGGRGG